MSFADYTAFAKYHARNAQGAGWRSKRQQDRDEWKASRVLDIPKVQAMIIEDASGIRATMGCDFGSPTAFLNVSQINIDFRGCATRFYTAISTTAPKVTFRFKVPTAIGDDNLEQFKKVISLMFFDRYKMYEQEYGNGYGQMVMFSVPDEEVQWFMETAIAKLIPLLKTFD
ncbi:hypothetical protein [Delftia phage PhiW-14]|uniref:Uncharacterized protein n=1 Tax=Delftia phage PhiW-14 TaxID=665032 RepID=C9DFY7_BPW14|nr:hypothetical protein DP-phiW-14_gp015 [Delftia phage PhiW-14]ACV50038.1 hypothetical protein [Delftia phage PhiW-14]